VSTTTHTRRRTSEEDLSRFASSEADVVRRLLDTGATINAMAAEYRVSSGTVERAYHRATTPEQRAAATRRKQNDRKPAARVRREADAIVARLLNGESIARIRAEYGCGGVVVCEAYAARTTKRQRREAERLCRRAVGSVTGFRPGQEPWNKGLKGIHLNPATEFRPGVLRGNAARSWTAVGTVRVRTEDGKKYRWVKLRDDGPPYGRWRPVAHVVWERTTGLVVPKFHRVIHLDLDTLNDDPANLKCMSPAEAARWQLANFPGHLKRFRKRAAAATRSRHAQARGVIEHRRSVARAFKESTHVVRSCAACGFETTSKAETCPKCRGSAWEDLRREVAAVPEASRLSRFLKQLEAVA
jgi:hypothetical protein